MTVPFQVLFRGCLMKKTDIYAKKITWVTLVGVFIKTYPAEHGNCFSVKATDGKEYRIVNFNHENMEEALRRGLKFPIKIKPIGKCVAIIHDSRIPDNWYDKVWCEVCCPGYLLPMPQTMRHERQIERGELIERRYGNYIISTVDFSKAPRFPKDHSEKNSVRIL